MINIEISLSLLRDAYAQHCHSLIKDDSAALIVDAPDIGKAVHLDRAMDDDSDEAGNHDNRLEDIGPDHCLHPTLAQKV